MKRTLMLAIVVGTIWPASASAQEAPGAFQELRNAGRLDPGDSFFVTRTDGTRVKGKLEEVRDGILRLRVHGRPIEFTENDVSRIERRDPTDDGTWLGVLIGAGALRAYSVTPGCRSDPEACGYVAYYLSGPLMLGGGLLGFLLDLEKTQVIFDPAVARAPRISVGPVVSRRQRGAALSIVW